MSPGLELGRYPDGATAVVEAGQLRTHGVVVGMTGSGKTGLGLVLLEELVAAGVPIIAVDPKGDLGNLGLIFPAFTAGDFSPWVGADAAAETARRWQSGLLSAGITADRVARLGARLALTVFTPGSTAGVPVNLLALLERPPTAAVADEDARRTVVSAAVSGLLGLAGRKSDPVRDPAHVTLSYIVDEAWRSARPMDLATLVLQLVDPPFERVGVFPVDTFFPPDDRMALAMDLNAILASPSFSTWQTGAALDPEALLARDEARTRVSVFNVAHLDDRQRQFFVALLLSRLLAWSRGQPGTEDLRALLFFDEVAGYLPPYPRNPPTKDPLLTLMKQARSVGLGVVVSTQNPVDLDYKALSNAGLWCIGRLSTPQDRDRLLTGIDGRDLDTTVAKLDKRHFLLYRAAREAPRVFGARHAMCFLRGPMTAVELARLNARYGHAPHQPGPDDVGPRPVVAGPEVSEGLRVPPTVPGLAQRFLDPRVAFSARLGVFTAQAPAAPDGASSFRPALYADLRLRFDEERVGFILDQTEFRVWFPLDDARPEAPVSVRLEPSDMLVVAPAGACFSPLPAWMDEEAEIRRLRRAVVDEVYRTETRGQFVNKSLRLYAKADEPEEQFRERCRAAVEARIDDQVARLREKFAAQAARLDDELATKTAALAELRGVARSRQLEEAVNIGATIMSFFSGRKKSVTSVVSKRRQASQAAHRVDRVESEITRLEAKGRQLEDELARAVAAIRADEEARLAKTEARPVRLERNDIDLIELGVLWVPGDRRI